MHPVQVKPEKLAGGVRHKPSMDTKPISRVNRKRTRRPEGARLRLTKLGLFAAAAVGIAAVCIAACMASPQAADIQNASLKIYGADEAAMHVVLDHEIFVPQNYSLLEKLDALAAELSRSRFKGLPVEVMGIENQKGCKVAQVNLVEDPALRSDTGRPITWSGLYFQGSAGGSMTTGTLLRTFLQREYPGNWIDGVRFYYENQPIETAGFDHLELYDIHWR
jgi:hypothetical protein